MFFAHWYKYFQFIKHEKIRNISSNIKNLIRYYCRVYYVFYCVKHNNIYYPIKKIPSIKKKCLICRKELLYY